VSSPVTSPLLDVRGVGDALVVAGTGGVLAVRGTFPRVERKRLYVPRVQFP